MLTINFYKNVTRSWLDKHLSHLDDDKCFCDKTCKSCNRLKAVRSELVENGYYTHHKEVVWWKIKEDLRTNAIFVEPIFD